MASRSKAKGKPAAPIAAPKRKGTSKLAKELKITAEQEAEMRHAFDLVQEMEGDADHEFGDVIQTHNLHKALVCVPKVS